PELLAEFAPDCLGLCLSGLESFAEECLAHDQANDRAEFFVAEAEAVESAARPHRSPIACAIPAQHFGRIVCGSSSDSVGFLGPGSCSDLSNIVLRNESCLPLICGKR